jgi:hypothetical protein
VSCRRRTRTRTHARAVSALMLFAPLVLRWGVTPAAGGRRDSPCAQSQLARLTLPCRRLALDPAAPHLMPPSLRPRVHARARVVVPSPRCVALRRVDGCSRALRGRCRRLALSPSSPALVVLLSRHSTCVVGCLAVRVTTCVRVCWCVRVSGCVCFTPCVCSVCVCVLI